MKALIFIALFTGLVFAGPVLDESLKYRLDMNHSNIGFAVPISGGLSKVRGKFTYFEMDLNFDQKKISKSTVKVKIKAASIDTGIESRDNHLKTADFFDVKNHPDITFVSKKIEVKNGRNMLVGDFTMRGVTKEIRFPFEVTGTWVNKEKTLSGSGFMATLIIDRRDFGLNYQRQGVPDFIGNKVEIDLNILAQSTTNVKAAAAKASNAR